MACDFQKIKAECKHYALMTQMAKPLLRDIFVIVRLHDCSLLNLSMHGGISNGNC